MKMKNPVSWIKSRKALIRLGIAFVILSVAFAAVFGIMAFVKAGRISIKSFPTTTLADAEKEDWSLLTDLSSSVYHDGEITSFVEISNNLQEQYEYLVPHFVYLKVDYFQERNFKKHIKALARQKSNFNATKKELLNACDILSEIPAENTVQAANQAATIKTALFTKTLPVYLKFIETKYNLVRFMHNVTNNRSYTLNPYMQSMMDVSNIYIDAAVYFTLPAVITNQTATVTGASRLQMNASVLGVYTLTAKMKAYKTENKNQTNDVKIAQFKEEFIQLHTEYSLYQKSKANLKKEHKDNLIKTLKIGSLEEPVTGTDKSSRAFVIITAFLENSLLREGTFMLPYFVV